MVQVNLIFVVIHETAKKKIMFKKICLLLISFFTFGSAFTQQEIIVGISDSPPLKYFDENNKPQGFFVDLLAHIAQQENWKLVYKHGDYNQCLGWLKNDEIDIMPGLGYTVERAKIFSFNKADVVSTWTLLISTPDLDIKSIENVNNKRVAYVKEDGFAANNLIGLKHLASQFDVKYKKIEVESYKELFEFLENKKADIGIVNRLYSDNLQDDYNFNKSPVTYSRVSLRFAFPNSNPLSEKLIHKIDNSIIQLKENRESYYYEILDKYIPKSKKTQIPEWYYYILYLGLGALIIFIINNIILKRAINHANTNLANASETIRANDSFLQLALNVAKQGTWNYDCEKDEVHYNKEFSEILNDEPSEVIGTIEHWTDRIFSADKKLIIKKLNSFLAGDVSEFSEDFRMQTFDGTAKWFFCQCRVISKTEDGKITQVIGALADISDRKRFESLYNESELKFNTFLNNSSSMIYIKDTKGVYSIVNKEFINVFKRSQEEIYGKTDADFFAAIYSDPIIANDSEVRDSGKTIQVEEKMFDGKNERIFLSIKFPLYDDANKVSSICGISIDITHYKEVSTELENHRKKLEAIVKEQTAEVYHVNEQLSAAIEELQAITEQLSDEVTFRRDAEKELEGYKNKLEIQVEKRTLELKESEENFRQLAENINSVFFLRTADNKILYINPAFETIFGYKKEILMEKPDILSTWIHPDDIKNMMGVAYSSELEKNGSLNLQYRIIRPDREIRWLWARSYPVYDETGKIYRIVGITNDITEIKEFEDKLQQAKEKAEESDRLKTAFLANMSHEIRTPLNAIVGFTHFLAMQGITQQQKQQYVKIINRNTTSLLNLIEDIIEIAKIDSGQIKIRESEFQIKELATELFDKFNNHTNLIEKKELNFEFVPHEFLDEVTILSDKEKIKQVLSNLLANAFKFTELGEVKFGYNVNDDDKNNKRLIFYVKDSGIGIDEDKLDSIFERFMKIEDHKTKLYRGTGIGLTIARSLSKLINGKISVESKRGIGSTFFLSIPFYSAPKPKLSLRNIIPDIADNYNWKNKTILIVEDELSNYLYLNALLTSTYAKIIHVTNGKHAVSICKENKNIDIVLMDIQLPEMNGKDATKAIKEFRNSLPIIAQTAHAGSNDIDECYEAGCNDYISKPINSEMLLVKINKYIMSSN